MAETTWIKTHRPGKCSECEAKIEEGDQALYEVGSHKESYGRRLYCEECGQDINPK